MFILMVSRGYPTYDDPQWGCFEKDQAEALTNLGHKVVMISVDSRLRFRRTKFGLTEFSKNGIYVYNYFLIPGKLINWFSYKLSLIIRQYQIHKLYRTVVISHGTPDIIYSQFFFNTALAVFLQKKYSIPLVAIEHAARFNEINLDKYTIKYATIAYRNADEIITVSESLKNKIKYFFNREAKVIYNSLGKEFCTNNLEKKNKNTSFQFVSVGTLEYRKGFDILINAFDRSELKYKNAKLLIIGEGEAKKSLTQQINALDLNQNIFLVGKKSKEEIVKILSESDVFVLTSRGETFGVVYIEAMALGLPVIATICGGPEEFIEEKDGLLIPIDDEGAVSEALNRIYNNIHKYDRQSISKRCLERFSPYVIAEKLVEVFDQVIAKYKK